MSLPIVEPSSAPRWDWYQASIPDRPDRVIEAIASGLPFVEFRDQKGQHGYAKRVDVLSGGELAAMVNFGGSNGAPNATASGDRAPFFAELVRREFPHHSVTRCDSCYDFIDDATTFESLHAILYRIAMERNISTGLTGDYERKVKGRTYYLGSKKSPAFMRLYEKGIQMQSTLIAAGAPLLPEWLRAEMQVRPQGSRKIQAAIVSPTDVWGYVRWGPSVADELLGASVARAAPVLSKDTSFQQAMYSMMHQYGRWFDLLGEKCAGDHAQIGRELAFWRQRVLSSKLSVN
jgi:hypothetical protein